MSYNFLILSSAISNTCVQNGGIFSWPNSWIKDCVRWLQELGSTHEKRELLQCRTLQCNKRIGSRFDLSRESELRSRVITARMSRILNVSDKCLKASCQRKKHMHFKGKKAGTYMVLQARQDCFSFSSIIFFFVPRNCVSRERAIGKCQTMGRTCVKGI